MVEKKSGKQKQKQRNTHMQKKQELANKKER